MICDEEIPELQLHLPFHPLSALDHKDEAMQSSAKSLMMAQTHQNKMFQRKQDLTTQTMCFKSETIAKRVDLMHANRTTPARSNYPIESSTSRTLGCHSLVYSTLCSSWL
jgi:hypothetical protein